MSAGWTVTVYYTAVASLHSGARRRVTGCPKIDCTHGHANLGTYPADFVQAVHDEGTGHTRRRAVPQLVVRHRVLAGRRAPGQQDEGNEGRDHLVTCRSVHVSSPSVEANREGRGRR